MINHPQHPGVQQYGQQAQILKQIAPDSDLKYQVVLK
jgi:hypothetical protein